MSPLRLTGAQKSAIRFKLLYYFGGPGHSHSDPIRPPARPSKVRGRQINQQHDSMSPWGKACFPTGTSQLLAECRKTQRTPHRPAFNYMTAAERYQHTPWKQPPSAWSRSRHTRARAFFGSFVPTRQRPVVQSPNGSHIFSAYLRTKDGRNESTGKYFMSHY